MSRGKATEDSTEGEKMEITGGKKSTIHFFSSRKTVKVYHENSASNYCVVITPGIQSFTFMY